MRTLLLLRHAKSSWKQPGLSDHDRPLNRRGQRDAPRIGRLLTREQLSPGAILSSSARRARETAEAVATQSAFDGMVQLEGVLYLAEPTTILDVIRHSGVELERLMVVGHNPGMAATVARLTGLTEDMPTAALAQIRLPIEVWNDLRPSTKGVLVNLWRPRDLD